MTRELFCYSHYAADPYFNMAFDEWMLSEASVHPNRLSIRLYTWGEGCITFGYNQNREFAFNHDKVGQTPVIRRITGGRALFHDPSELTYSVAFSDRTMGHNPARLAVASVTASSAVLAEVLVAFLGRIGIRSDYAHQSGTGRVQPAHFHKAPCFASHARHEIISAGEKLVASAQRRANGAILQHGAIKIGGLAAHPALSLSDVNQLAANKLVAVGRAQFLRHRAQFVASFSDRFGPVAQDVSLADEQLRVIEQIVDRIRENPFARRDIFKQSDAESSLLGA